MSYLGLDIGGSKCRYEWWPYSDVAGGVTEPIHPAVDDTLAEKLSRQLQEMIDVDPAAAVVAMAGIDSLTKKMLRGELSALGVAYPVAIVEDRLAAAAAAGTARGV